MIYESGGNIDQIISRLSNTKLKGSELWASCPLGIHVDKNPSFSINLESEVYLCFSCGESGNAYQLAIRMGLKPEGTFQPSFKRSKPKAIQPWQRAKRIGEAFDTVEDIYNETYRQKRNILEQDWNEGKISESKYYAKRQIIDYQFDTQMEVHGENRNLLSFEAKNGGRDAKFERDFIHAD